MNDDPYKAALERAKADMDALHHELDRCTQAREELEIRLGKVRETIAALCAITGEEFAEGNAPGITDAIRLALKMVPAQQMTPLDVRKKLLQLGFDFSNYGNVLASVHAVLQRLEAKREIRKSKKREGKTAYTWIPRLGARAFRNIPSEKERVMEQARLLRRREKPDPSVASKPVS